MHSNESTSCENRIKLPLHGGDIYSHEIDMDFSVNTNPCGPSMAVLQAFKGCVEDIVHYPDPNCVRLRDGISNYERVNPWHIICGNGAAELIYSIVRAIEPERALLIEPTFSEYEKALRSVGAACEYYICKEENDFRVQEDVLERISPRLGMIFLCNPGNPIGELIPKELILRILEQAKKYYVPVVLDECFLDFVEDADTYEMLRFYEQYPNLFVLKAFTKIFCIPGLRLGYGISSNQELLRKMRDGLPAWNVSSPAQICGVAALKDVDVYKKETIRYLSAERQSMICNLEKLGYRIYGSKANYIFFSSRSDEEGSRWKEKGRYDLYERALENKILIRDCSNYPGLEKGYYRIAIRSREENERLIQWLRKL